MNLLSELEVVVGDAPTSLTNNNLGCLPVALLKEELEIAIEARILISAALRVLVWAGPDCGERRSHGGFA